MFPGNFGAIRLLMALFVIIGHTPELIDGNRHRELFTSWFGVMSFGEAAVDGFFLVSGYMLALSVVKSGSLANYFVKRVARIYPGFIVSFILCLLIVNPLAGGVWNLHETLANLARLVLLKPPASEAAFAGAPYPALNGAMWTISYEFFCYILLAALFASGILKRNRLFVCGVIGLNVLLLTQPHLDLAGRQITFGGGSQNTLRFVTAFCTGAAYRQILSARYRNGWVALLGAGILLLTLRISFLAEPSLIVIGGYILICLGEARLGAWISRIGQDIDLSYGIYLYAWPVQNLAIWRFGLTSLAAIDIVAITVSGFLAFFSWTLIERPAMRAAIGMTRRRGSRTGPSPLPLVVEDSGAP